MAENMKKFLEALSKDETLYSKFTNAAKEDLLALAKELGIELTETDLEQKTKLDDDVLDTVAGGKDCVCVLGGGGEWNNKTCACVMGGGGQTSDSKPRCVCAINGWGAD